MDFHDFPMILGKSGKYEIHPPKLCASPFRTFPGMCGGGAHAREFAEDRRLAVRRQPQEVEGHVRVRQREREEPERAP